MLKARDVMHLAWEKFSSCPHIENIQEVFKLCKANLSIEQKLPSSSNLHLTILMDKDVLLLPFLNKYYCICIVSKLIWVRPSPSCLKCLVLHCLSLSNWGFLFNTRCQNWLLMCCFWNKSCHEAKLQFVPYT